MKPDDESFVVFISSREGNVPHIFRVNADGSALRKVIPSPTRGDPAFVSPDGKSLSFIAADGTRLMRMPIDGSQEPTVFAERVIAAGTFSPDGTKIAYAAYVRANPDDPGSERGMGIVTPVNGGAPLITFEGRSRLYGWAPQSDGIDGVLYLGGAGNIWRQKLSGGEPQKVTNFDSGFIQGFAWAKDGTLYLGRGEPSADIVLISGFK